MKLKKLAIVITHPIQYYAPVFQLLHSRRNIEIMVFYTWGAASMEKFDPGFHKKIKWDLPLLDGYPYQWVENTAKDPGSHHFKGIVCPEIIPQINTWKPDAILCYGWASKAHLRVMRYFHGKIPVLFRGDSTLLSAGSSVKKVFRYIWLKWVYRHIDLALYTGSHNKRYFEHYAPGRTRLTFAPHAIDNERFMADESEAAAKLRQSFGIKAEEIVILYCGKFDPVKNIPLLLDAFIQLNDQQAHLILAGQGKEEKKLKETAQSSRMALNIHFMDFQNQRYMPVLYQMADIFCLPSVSETWGLSINEAMACSRAVLASDRVGSAIDLVKPSNGSTFQSNNTSSLLAQLREMISAGKSKLKEMGDQSGQLISEWNFETQAAAIETATINHGQR